MSTLRKRLCVALCVIACACMAVVGVTFANSQKASAEASGAYSDSPVMVDGASIRLDAQKNGIRFATFLPAEVFDNMPEEAWAEIEMGTLFIPKAVLDANDKVATDLVLDATFGGISPAVAVFDGNTDNFVTDPAFEGGYLVNAVLELTSFTNVEQALNGEIVARSYFKDLTGVNETAYLAPVTRAPAFVAAEEILEAEGEYDSTLDTYVQHVEIVAPTTMNLSAWAEGVAAPKTNVAGIAVTNTIATAAVKEFGDIRNANTVLTIAKENAGKIEGVVEGDTTIVVSALKGALTKTIPVTVSMPQVVFFGDNYNPTETNFTIRATDVAKLEIESATTGLVPATALAKTEVLASKYTVNAEDAKVIEIAKADLLGANLKVEGDYILTITTSTGDVSTVPVYVRKATAVNFEEGDKIGKLVLLEGNMTRLDPTTITIASDAFNSGAYGQSLQISTVSNLTNDGKQRYYLSFNLEYLKAYLADNTGKSIQLTFGLKGNFGTSSAIGWNHLNSTGTAFEVKSWNNANGVKQATNDLNATFSQQMANLAIFNGGNYSIYTAYWSTVNGFIIRELKAV